MSNNTIYEQNYELLHEDCPWIYNDLEEHRTQQCNVYTYETAQHTVGMYWDFQEKGIIQMGSQYDPKGYAAVWCAAALRDNPFEKNSFIFIFGLGSGEYVKALVNHMSEENVVFIYEPDLNVLRTVLEKIVLKDLIRERVFLMSSGKQGKYCFESVLKHNVDLSNVCNMKIYELPNYGDLFEEEYVFFASAIRQMMYEVGMQLNTQNTYAEKMTQNLLASMGYVLRSSSMAALLEQLPKGYPGIVISAGPSLRKNMNELKRAKGKALLVATDTALKPLLENDIIPDIYITVDYAKGDFVFKDEKTWDIPVAACAESKAEIIPKARNKVFLFDTTSSSMAKYALSVIGKEEEMKMVVGGGSVAHVAMSFLLLAEMDPIIFVGQDLAYPDGKLHVDGVFENNGLDERKKYIMVEDIEGNQVPSDRMMTSFKDYFEFAIKSRDDVRYIDATEGGAKIQGTIIQTLKETIDAECVNEFDYEGLIQSVPDMLSEDEKKEYLKVITGFENDMQELIEKAKDLKGNYEALDKLLQTEKPDKSEIESLLEKTAEATTYFDEEAGLYPLIMTHALRVRNKVKMLLSKRKDNVDDELQHLALNGMELANSICESAEQLEPAMKEYAQQMREEYAQYL